MLISAVFKAVIYHWCCITKGESTMLVFMWHHTWMTFSDPVLHCSSSWCHLSRQLVSNNSVCIARWWAITISSRGCGNVVTVSVSPACSWLLKLPSHDHQISFVNKDCVYIHASEKKAVKCWFFFFFGESSELTTTGHAVMSEHKESNVSVLWRAASYMK